jgi:hypothetical protein
MKKNKKKNKKGEGKELFYLNLNGEIKYKID